MSCDRKISGAITIHRPESSECKSQAGELISLEEQRSQFEKPRHHCITRDRIFLSFYVCRRNSAEFIESPR